jgi:hypothetical protein
VKHRNLKNHKHLRGRTRKGALDLAVLYCLVLRQSTMNATKREALIQSLGECRRQLDYFVSFLEGYDEDFLASLRSASENIKSALERLASSQE